MNSRVREIETHLEARPFPTQLPVVLPLNLPLILLSCSRAFISDLVALFLNLSREV